MQPTGRGNFLAGLLACVMLAATVAVVQLVGGGDDDEPAAAAGQPAADATDDAESEPVSYPAVTATPQGHHGEYAVQYDDLPPETKAQLDTVQAIIERYPTAADAIADGWTPATTNLKGIASHFLKGGVVTFGTGLDERFEVAQPEVLLFDGIEGDAPIVGVSYLISSPDTPEGFDGPWDVWHRHQAVCFAGGLVIAEVGGHEDSAIDIEEAECAAQGGLMFPIDNLSMIHVWMKPGFASEHGVFSHDHPELL